MISTQPTPSQQTLTNKMAPGCFMEANDEEYSRISNSNFTSSMKLHDSSITMNVNQREQQNATQTPSCEATLESAMVEDLKAQLAVMQRQLEQTQIDNKAKERIIASLQQKQHPQPPARVVDEPAPFSQPAERSTTTLTSPVPAPQAAAPTGLNMQLGQFLRNKAFNNEMGVSMCQNDIDSQLQKLMQDRLASVVAQHSNAIAGGDELHHHHEYFVDDDSSSVSSTTTSEISSSERTDGEISSSDVTTYTVFENLQRQSLERIQHQKMTQLAYAPPPVAAVTVENDDADGIPVNPSASNASVDDIVGQIQRFLFLRGGNLRDVPSLLDQYSHFCRTQCDMPHLDRLFFAGMMRPPKVSAFTWQWEEGKDVAHEEIPHLDDSFHNLQEGRSLQVRLTAASKQAVPPGCEWFKEGNYQDYLALPIYYQGEFAGAMTWATKSSNGFSEKEIQIFHESLAALSTVLRLHTNDLNMKVMEERMMDEVRAQTLDLAESNQRLVENNKRVMKQAQDQLKHFAMMSHEIRTPLNCIVGLSNLLLESPENPLDAQVEDSLSMITASGDLLLAVVDDVLDYSKLSTGNVEIEIAPMNIRKAVRTVVESIRIKAASLAKNGDKLEFRTDISNELPEWVDLDGRRLQQILYNLLGNAIKFGKLGKYVDFGIKVIHEMDESADESAGNGSKSFMLFSIKDYGTGIAEQDLKTIFQPFQQSSSNDAADGGTGLGLAITSQLCKVLGGDISVTSEKGKWSEFVVKLPLISSASKDTPVVQDSPSISTSPLIEMDRREMGRNMSQKLRASFMNLSQSKLELDSSSFSSIPLNEEPSKDTDAPVKDVAPIIQAAKEVLSPVLSKRQGTPPLPPKPEAKSISRAKSTAAAPAAAPPAGAKSLEESPFENLRVLIAEDNLINQKVLNRTLMKLGMKNVDIVPNGLEAVNKSADNEYDVIFMDWNMPVMDGLEATKQIVARRDIQPEAVHPRILFLTAHALEDYREAAAEAGGDGFISKPFKLASIKDFLEKQELDRKPDEISQSCRF